jgi:putative phosphoribosyl transferase
MFYGTRGDGGDMGLSGNIPFRDRRDAGRQIAEQLMRYKNMDPVVLALPRGGVPVGHEVAQALGAPLDVLLVRKIRAPNHPELGLGAVVDGDPHLRVLNRHVMTMINPSQEYIDAEEQRQLEIIRQRRKLYRGNRPPVALEGRSVIVVDDGIATGGTMKIALTALSGSGAGKLVLAVPVAPRETIEQFADDADEVVCLLTPESFRAVSLYYADFRQTTDDEVVELLDTATRQFGQGDDGAQKIISEPAPSRTPSGKSFRDGTAQS